MTRAKQDVTSIQTALNLYKLDNFAYPSSEQGLEALVAKPSGPPDAPNWKGPYLDRVPKDPWGKALPVPAPRPARRDRRLQQRRRRQARRRRRGGRRRELGVTPRNRESGIAESRESFPRVIGGSDRSSDSRFPVSDSYGFTLIELLVVVVIVDVLAAALTLAVAGNAQRRLADEAERFRALLAHACGQAELSGREIGAVLSPSATHSPLAAVEVNEPSREHGADFTPGQFGLAAGMGEQGAETLGLVGRGWRCVSPATARVSAAAARRRSPRRRGVR